MPPPPRDPEPGRVRRRPLRVDRGPSTAQRPLGDGDARALGAILADPETFGSVLLVAAVDRIDAGTDALAWDPEAIASLLEDAAGGARISIAGAHRLGAALTVVGTDLFWTDVSAFVDVCNALYDGVGPDAELDIADAEECAWGVVEAALLMPPGDGTPEFSEPIRRYVAGVLADEGLIAPPSPLRWAVPEGEDNLGLALGDLGDDATLVAAVGDRQRGRTAAIERDVRLRIRRLHAQLAALPLRLGRAPDAPSGLLR